MPVSENSVLVADDDPALRGLVRLVARRAGFDVDVASNGIEAMEKLDANRYLIAVIDLMMPRMSGYEVLDALATRAERPAVIVITAAADGHIARLNPAVVNSIIHKPFDIEMLSALLKEIASALSRDSKEEDRVSDSAGEVDSVP